MVRPTLIIVTEDPGSVHKTQSFGFSLGAQVEVYTPAQWQDKMRSTSVPALVQGSQAVNETGKILQFPNPSLTATGTDKQVESINDLEAKAIENAIHAFKGNLTEAAKALGIGRATLYRKVKQYNIDPANARKRKAA